MLPLHVPRIYLNNGLQKCKYFINYLGRLERPGGHLLQRQAARAASTALQGHAEPTKLAEYAAKHADTMLYRKNPRSELLFPGVGFGGEEQGGLSIADRSAIMRVAITQKGANAVYIDGDVVLARANPASMLYCARDMDRTWEAVTLHKLIASERISRGSCVILLKLAMAGVPLADGSTSSLQADKLLERVQQLLAAQAISTVDVLNIALPSAHFGGADTELPSLVNALNSVVSKGLARHYAFSCENWLPLPMRDASGRALQPILKTVESSWQHGGTSPLIALGLPCNLASPNAFLPLTVDTHGKEWSTVDLLADYGLTTMLKNPFDAVVNGRAFRCVNTSHHRAHHPARVTSLLNDVLNYSIHCEVMWDKQVKSAVLEEVHARKDAPGAAPSIVERKGDPSDDAPPSLAPSVSQLQPTDVAWGRIIAQQLRKGFTLLEWRQVKERRVKPAFYRLRDALADLDASKEWFRGYHLVFQDVIQKVDLLVEQEHAYQADALSAKLSDLYPSLPKDVPLHSKVQSVLLAAPDTVLFAEAPEAFAVKRNKRLRLGVGPEGAPTDEVSAGPEKAPVVALEQLRQISFKEVQSKLESWYPALQSAMQTQRPPLADPMEGVPTQAELAPVQAAMRKARRSLPHGQGIPNAKRSQR